MYEGMHHEVVIVYCLADRSLRGTSILDHAWQVPVHAANIGPDEGSFIGSLEEFKKIGPREMLAKHFREHP